MTLKHPEYANGLSNEELIKEALEFCNEELDAYEGMEYDDDSEVCCQRSNTFIRELVARLTAVLWRPSKEPVAEIVAASTPAAEILYGRDVKFYEALRSLPIGTKLYAAPQPVLSQPEVKAAYDDDVYRAADALLGTLWQKAWSGARTHEQNWEQMDRQFPQARWLHDALKALCPLSDIPAQAGEVVIEWPVGEAEVVIFDPRRDPIPRREPYKIIDASLWFMDRAEIGERLYTKAQVEEILRSALIGGDA